MKKHISLAFTLALLMVISFGCKVGADDPASMASRDGRLIRSWKLTAVDGLSTDITVIGTVSNTSTKTTTYNGTIWTEVNNPGGTTTNSYTLEYVIEKGGKLTVTETIDGAITVSTTSWEWLNNDKNKAELLLDGSIVTVTRLSSKELVLDTYSKRVVTDTNFSSTNEDAMKMTFAAE